MKIDYVGNTLQFEAGGKITIFSQKVYDEIILFDVFSTKLSPLSYNQPISQRINIFSTGNKFQISLEESGNKLSIKLYSSLSGNLTKELFNYSLKKLKETFNNQEQYLEFIDSFHFYNEGQEIYFQSTEIYSKYESLVTILGKAFEIIVDSKEEIKEEIVQEEKLLQKSQKLISSFLNGV